MEIITQQQLRYHRTVIGSIGCARRKWKHTQEWFPEEQAKVYKHMSRVYDEIKEKYGEELFLEYVHERHLNKRAYRKKIDPKDYVGRLESACPNPNPQFVSC